MKKIIYIAFNIYPENSGQSIYTASIARSLSQYAALYIFTYGMEEDIKKIGVNGENVREIHAYQYCGESILSNLNCKMKVINYVNERMLSDIEECINKENINAIIVEHIGMSEYLLRLKKKYKNIIFIYSSENVEMLNIKEALLSGTRTNKFWRLRSYLHKRQEQKTLKYSDAVLCVSQKDADYFKNELDVKKPLVVSHPNFEFSNVWDDENAKVFKKRLLIVGSMNWYPNVTGIIDFVNNIFLELLKKDDEYELYIVGKNPVEEVIKLGEENNNIIVTGFVEDLDEYYKKCDVAIVPVKQGTGIKIKLIEAIGKGIPVIATNFSAKDYVIKDHEILTYDNFKEFYKCIDYLCIDQTNRFQQHKKSLELYFSIIGDNQFWSEIFEA